MVRKSCVQMNHMPHPVKPFHVNPLCGMRGNLSCLEIFSFLFLPCCDIFSEATSA